MDFLKKFAETSLSKEETLAEKTPEKTPPKEGEQSNSDLMADAKLVADAARSTFNKETPKYENSQVAGAAGDLLDAAQKYGKLDEASGVGSYLEKAENYLHDYEAKNTSKPREAEVAPPTEPKKEEGEAKPASEPEPEKKEEAEAKPSEPEPEKKEEDFAKIAEGGLSKLAGGFKF